MMYGTWRDSDDFLGEVESCRDLMTGNHFLAKEAQRIGQEWNRHGFLNPRSSWNLDLASSRNAGENLDEMSFGSSRIRLKLTVMTFAHILTNYHFL